MIRQAGEPLITSGAGRPDCPARENKKDAKRAEKCLDKICLCEVEYIYNIIFCAYVPACTLRVPAGFLRVAMSHALSGWQADIESLLSNGCMTS